MAAKTREVYVPIDGFIADVDGSPVNFHTNIRVREGHWLLEKYPHLFKPIKVHYDVEDASAEPGRKRAA